MIWRIVLELPQLERCNMSITGYQTVNYAGLRAKSISIPTATIFMTSMIVGQLMKSTSWFSYGLIGGAAAGGFVAYKIRGEVDDIVWSLTTKHERLETAIIHRVDGMKSFRMRSGTSPNPLRALVFVNCFTGGLTALAVGRFVLPRLVAFGSGLTAGCALGMGAILLPVAIFEKRPSETA